MTRHPKRGKGSRWTVHELNAVPPTWKGDTLSDGEGPEKAKDLILGRLRNVTAAGLETSQGVEP